MAFLETPSNWKKVEPTHGEISFHLRDGSAVRAIRIPNISKPNTSTTIRVSVYNDHNFVDANVDFFLFQRDVLPNKRRKLLEWVKLDLVESLIWSVDDACWQESGSFTGATRGWCGTFETEVCFPKGSIFVVVRVVARVPEETSKVFPWKFYV